MKLKIQGDLSDTTTLRVVNAETGEPIQLVQRIDISVGVGDVKGQVTITVLDMELDLTTDDPEFVTTTESST